MADGKPYELSLELGQGECRVLVDGLALNICLKPPKEGVSGAAPMAVPIPQLAPGNGHESGKLVEEADYYRQISLDIYTELGQLAKKLNLSLQDLTLAEVINNIGGGWRFGRTPKAVQVGGPLGAILPVSLLNLTLSHDTLRELGGTLAVGVIQVLDERDCLVSLVLKQISFILDQPGGQCPACHQALIRVKELLTAVTEGKGGEETLEELQQVCEKLKLRGSCNLSRQAVNPVLTSLHYFPE